MGVETQKTRKVVGLARKVADRWLATNAHAEYRLTVYQPATPLKNLPAMLRLFRDGRTKIGSVDPIRDLGVKVGFDHLEVWTANREGLVALDKWFQDHGCETSGVW